METDDQNVTLCLPRPSSGGHTGSPTILTTPKPRELPQNHVLLRVDRFGFSANNITYQALGEHPHFRFVSYPLVNGLHVSDKAGTLTFMLPLRVEKSPQRPTDSYLSGDLPPS